MQLCNISQLQFRTRSILFKLCSSCLLFRYISRSVRLKRRRFFNKYLANRQMPFGLAFSTNCIRFYNRFMVSSGGGRFTILRRLWYLKRLDSGLYSQMELLFYFAHKQWRNLFFFSKLFSHRARVTALRSLTLLFPWFSFVQLPATNFNYQFQLLYRSRVAAGLNILWSVPQHRQVSIYGGALLRKFYVFWLKISKPWWRFYLYSRNSFVLVKRQRMLKWAKVRHFRYSFISLIRFRSFIPRVKNFINVWERFRPSW
jgi:hypothetical protein